MQIDVLGGVSHLDVHVTTGAPAVLASGSRNDAREGKPLFNSAVLAAGGRAAARVHKKLLPTYDVFDEARYFAPGRVAEKLWGIGGMVAGVSVCEDIWSPAGPPAQQAAAGAKVLLNINGSPYHVGKGVERAQLLASEARRSGVQSFSAAPMELRERIVARLTPFDELAPGTPQFDRFVEFVLHLLGQPSALDALGPVALRDAVVAGMVGGIRRRAERGPVVIWVDDVQWAAPALLDLLESLARQLAGFPVLIATTFRPDAETIDGWPPPAAVE